MRKTLIVSLLILAGLSGTAANADDGSLLTYGLRSYNAGDYTGALAAFTTVAAKNGELAEPHYLIAITMVKMNWLSNAIVEYQKAIAIDAKGPYGRQAQVGLQRLLAVVPALQTGSGTVNGAAVMKSAADPSVLAALDKISYQAHFRQRLEEKATEQNVESIEETTDRSVNLATQRKNQEVADMQAASIVNADGDSIPAYSPGQINAVAAAYQKTISNMQQAGDDDVAKAQASGIKSIAAVDDAVSSLRSQLAGINGDGVKLIPAGTNLYVRNYASLSPGSTSAPQPQQLPNQLVATQDKMILQPNKAGGNNSPNLKLQARRSQLQVRGHLNTPNVTRL